MSNTFLRATLFSSSLAISVAVFGESIARADVLPEGAEDCGYSMGRYSTGESLLGKSCNLGDRQGTCQKAKCYPFTPHLPVDSAGHTITDSGIDAAPPEPFECYQCTEPSSTQGASGGNADGTGGNAAGNNGKSSNGGGGCSVGGTARSAAPWLLAVAAALIVSGARRRRNAR